MTFYKILTINKLIAFNLFVFSSFSSFSQEEKTHNYYWTEGENQNAMIGVNNCYVRNAPTKTAILLDSLQIGKEVLILKSTDNLLKIKGINVSWTKIQYKTNKGEIKIGFLWKGFLALGFKKNKQNTFLTTIDKIESKATKDNNEQQLFSISAKALDNNNVLLDLKTIQKNVVESYYFEDKTIGSLGLKNISEIYRISFNGEACAIPSLYYYFGWNGLKLIQLPEKYSIGDAGVYYHSEDYIFPKEIGGKPDLIIKKIREGTNNDETGESDEYIFNVSEWTETYKWDGEKATFIIKSKAKKFTEK